MLKDIFSNIVHANGATVLVSAVAIFTLAVFKEQIDGRLKGRLKMPIPIDLIVVIFKIFIQITFNDMYNSKKY